MAHIKGAEISSAFIDLYSEMNHQDKAHLIINYIILANRQTFLTNPRIFMPINQIYCTTDTLHLRCHISNSTMLLRENEVIEIKYLTNVSMVLIDWNDISIYFHIYSKLFNYFRL